MKNITILINSDEIINYVGQIWRSDIFKTYYADPDSYIRKIVDKYAGFPKFFYDMSDKFLETPHFSMWWGGIAHRRHYDNPVIHDLYYLHEIVHLAEMYWFKDISRTNFGEKMRENETIASIATEIEVYFHMPELRAQSLKQEIFADQFLNNPYYTERFKTEPELVMREIALHRRNARTKPPETESEKWLAHFKYKNLCWKNIWAIRYVEVENRMVEFTQECQTLGKLAAMNRLMDWLLSDEISEGTGIPFVQEARAFAGVHWQGRCPVTVQKEKTKEVA